MACSTERRAVGSDWGVSPGPGGGVNAYPIARANIRAAMYMPAMSAVRHEPRAKAFYEALVARG